MLSPIMMIHLKQTGWVGLILLAVLGLGLGGCQKPAAEEVKETPRNVRVLSLKQDSLTEYFEITGPVAPVRGTDISAQESGPVVNILVNKGATVTKGQPLLQLERDILRAEMESALAALETQTYNLDKVQKLFAAGKVSRMELLNAESQQQSAQSLADVSSQRHSRALIVAPFAGVLTDRYVELGQLVLPGQPVARCIDPYTLKLEGYLTGNQIAWAQEGTQATVELGEGDLTANGTITWVGLEADRNTGKFKVEIEIPNPELRLRSGVIGRARIAKNITRDVVTIPRDAVMEGRHGTEVFVVDGDRARRVAVTLGPDQGPMVVVLEGLSGGNRLVVRGHRDLVDDCLVTVTETATSPDGSVATDPGIVGGAGAGATQ